jgi:hypothetical protein
MRYTALLLTIFAAVGNLSAQPASANIIPGSASYFTEIDGVPPDGPGNGVFQSTPQTNGGSINAGTLDVSASASATSQPVVSASAASTGCTSNGCGGGTLGATAKVDYFFVVSGPGGEFVPLDVAVRGGGSVIGDYATGYVSVQLGAFDVYTSLSNGSNGQVNPATCSSQGCINTTIRLNALPNSSYEIQMEASAGAYDDVDDSSSIWADPYIYIDPAFTNASLYSVDVSPGVGNSPASVPEPTAVALFVIGLVGLGAVRMTFRRRFRGLTVVGSNRGKTRGSRGVRRVGFGLG